MNRTLRNEIDWRVMRPLRRLVHWVALRLEPGPAPLLAMPLQTADGGLTLLAPLVTVNVLALRFEAGALAKTSYDNEPAHEPRISLAGRRYTAAQARDSASNQSDIASDGLDHKAILRDLAGEQRDRAADRRDTEAEVVEAAAADTGTIPISRAVQARQTAASDRSYAASDRAEAAKDRKNAEANRQAARADRNFARIDREAAASDRLMSSVDALTGAYLRGPGLIELENEIDRATRNGFPLILAFVDIDDLKSVNDSSGHAAGDRVLREVADTLRRLLRSYDRVIRFGGDEFVCVLSKLDMPNAMERFERVKSAVAEGSMHGSITVGLAQFESGDSLEDFIQRADAALNRERNLRDQTRFRAEAE